MVDRPLVRRRTAVTAALGGLAVVGLAGCDNGDDLAPPEADPSESTATSPATPSTQAPEQTPDEVLVQTVADQLLAAMGVLGEARKFAALRPVVNPVLRAHRAHVEVLEVDGASRSASLVPPNSAVALQQVRQSEQHLQTALVDAAGRAESGALARLLASMSASVTQHLVALPKEA